MSVQSRQGRLRIMNCRSYLPGLTFFPDFPAINRWAIFTTSLRDENGAKNPQVDAYTAKLPNCFSVRPGRN